MKRFYCKYNELKHKSVFRIFITVMLFVCLVPLTMQAQEEDAEPGFMGKLKAEKISFIANKLQLTPKEAQVFWPVYNEWEQKRFRLEGNKRMIEQKINGDIKTLSEAELAKTNDRYIELTLKEAELMKEYNTRLKEILPIYKVLQLYKAEKQFRAYILKDLKRRSIERSPNFH